MTELEHATTVQISIQVKVGITAGNTMVC